MQQRTLQGSPRGNHRLILCSGHPDACWVDKTLPPHGKATSNAPPCPNTKMQPSPVLENTHTTSGLCLQQMAWFNHATTIIGSPDRIILFIPHKKPNTFMYYLNHSMSSITPRPLQKVWSPHYISMRVPGKFGKLFLGLRNLLFTDYVQQGMQHIGTETKHGFADYFSHHLQGWKGITRRNWLPQIKNRREVPGQVLAAWFYLQRLDDIYKYIEINDIYNPLC